MYIYVNGVAQDISGLTGNSYTLDNITKDTKVVVVFTKPGVPPTNIDKDDDGTSDTNLDTDGDGDPDVNIDTDGDGDPDINVDTDGDGIPDLNIDADGDGIPDAKAKKAKKASKVPRTGDVANHMIWYIILLGLSMAVILLGSYRKFLGRKSR